MTTSGENPLLSGIFCYICNGLVLFFAKFLSLRTLPVILKKHHEKNTFNFIFES
jgi:hypothetical protein